MWGRGTWNLIDAYTTTLVFLCSCNILQPANCDMKCKRKEMSNQILSEGQCKLCPALFTLLYWTCTTFTLNVLLWLLIYLENNN